MGVEAVEVWVWRVCPVECVWGVVCCGLMCCVDGVGVSVVCLSASICRISGQRRPETPTGNASMTSWTFFPRHLSPPVRKIKLFAWEPRHFFGFPSKSDRKPYIFFICKIWSVSQNEKKMNFQLHLSFPLSSQHIGTSCIGSTEMQKKKFVLWYFSLL